MRNQSRRRLLYLSPVIPAIGGNGLAMRAGALLYLLARHHAVTLVAMPRYPPFAGIVPPELARLCERVAVLRPPPRRALAAAWNRLRRSLASAARTRLADEATPPELPFIDDPFDVVHAFRLSMLDCACRYAVARHAHVPELHLDLDDIESDVLRGLADLHRANGHVAAADAAAEAARRAWTLEHEALGSFDRVYVCSETDRQRLAGRSRAQICVLPNTVRPAPLEAIPTRAGTFQLLFVGTLGYSPNADAVSYLCTEIVPRLERQTPHDFRVVIVGGGASRPLRRLARSPRITFAGRVPGLAPLYGRTGAAVVPMRAGGGTRIKVLEAFSYRCPVVTTTIGIAGIEARHGEHVLIADTPDEFASCCARVIHDVELGRRLAAASFDLVGRLYSFDAAAAMLDAIAPPPRHGRAVAPARAPV